LRHSDTKQLILSTALELFSKQGYAGSSIRQIARAVNITESAIYNHYTSKEEIFNAILTDFKSRTIGEIVLSDDLLNDLVSPEKFLKNFALKLINHWNSPEERMFIRLVQMEQFTKIGSKELSVTDYLNELRSICKMIFGEMIKHGVIKKQDSQFFAEEFTAQLFFLRTELMSSDDAGNFKVVLEKVNRHIDFFWNAVRAI
jgi:AcrR family transcriptional regulator